MTDKNTYRSAFLPYGRQDIDQQDIDAVVEVLKGDYLTTGPQIAKFEKKLAERVDAKYAVAVSNGTAALHAACFAAGIESGDEVITTPITFAASANCALYMGAVPVFADIDPKTYNIDPEDIRRKITGRTKAIIPVHFTGRPCDMDGIHRLAEEYGLVVIEDGAHALGAEYKGGKIGGLSHMTTFSFHPVKHITTGEGGAITTNDEILYRKLSMFRSHGITRDTSLLAESHDPWYYEQQFLGYNYRITDIQAALGISQLSKLEGYLEKRIEYAGLYNKAFSEIEELMIPSQEEAAKSAWHLYVLQFRLERFKAGRKEIYEEFIRRKIGVNVHYIPVYYHPYYKKLGYAKGLCPRAEKLYERILSIPLFPKMEMEDVQYVIKSTREIVDMYRVD